MFSNCIYSLARTCKNVCKTCDQWSPVSSQNVGTGPSWARCLRRESPLARQRLISIPSRELSTLFIKVIQLLRLLCLAENSGTAILQDFPLLTVDITWTSVAARFGEVGEGQILLKIFLLAV